MRIPGEGTDQLINRRQEAAVYQVIEGKHICDVLRISTHKMAIKSRNSWKAQEYVIH